MAKLHTIIVTNNPLVKEKFTEDEGYEVRYSDISYRDVLVATRDLVYSGHELLTHPLSGSVKPKETVVKSVAVSYKAGKMDLDQAGIAENSIITCDKFPLKFPILPEVVLNDFRLVDLSLITTALL